MKRLIVTADDFGVSAEVNEAVEDSHRRGILSAASLMVAGHAAADAVRRARALPSLRVGLHIVLVEDRPVLPPSQIPDLVDAGGLFRADMAASGASMFFRPAVRRQMRAEIAAQFEAFRATGLTLDHVNTHKHFHLHPSIAGAIIDLAREYGVRAIRVPLEPRAVLARIEAQEGRGVAAITEPFARLLRGRFRRAGIMAPDQVFGLKWSGAMTLDRLGGLIENLPDGLTEIYCHPATGPYPGSAPGYRYADEYAALVDAGIAGKLAQSGAVRGGFRDFRG